MVRFHSVNKQLSLNRAHIETWKFDTIFIFYFPFRCLTSRGTGVAEFLGIHNAEASSPAFVYRGALRPVRQYLNTFCNKRDEVPELLLGIVCGLEYLHNKGLVHMELTQDTVTVSV